MDNDRDNMDINFDNILGAVEEFKKKDAVQNEEENNNSD